MSDFAQVARDEYFLEAKTLIDNKQTQVSSSGWLRDVIFLIFGLVILYSIFLGYRPLSVPDEARYAEIPREMVEMSNYLTPHLNYVKYFEKPAFFYWLQAGSIKLFGVTELAVRIPNAIMAILGCLFVYGIGRIVYDRRIGLAASLILASSVLYFIMGHLVTIDMTLSTLLTGSLFCFLLGVKSDHRFAFYGFYALSALAVLTKGLIGIIFPALIIGSWILLLNEWRVLKKMYLGTGLIIFLAVALPWHLLVQLHNPEFFHFYILEQQFLRYFTNIANRSQPPGFFVATLLLGLLPWSLFLIQAFHYSLPKSWRARLQDRFTVFLLLWPVLIFGFFGCSHSKLIPYILPVFPPLAVIISRYLVDQWDKKDTITKSTKIAYLLLPCLILASGLGVLITKLFYHIPTLEVIYPELLAILAIWGVGSAVSAWFIWRKQQAASAFLSLLISSFCVYLIVLLAMPKADPRSIQPLAQTIKTMKKPDDVIATYDNYYQDLPFYLRQRITVASWQNELSFGMAHQDTSSWMISTAAFWQLWQSPKKVFMITDNDTYKDLLKSGLHYHFNVLGRTRDNILVVNH